MSLNLPLTFISSGGIPPTNSTFLEIYQDGRTALLVGNALAEGGLHDEAGLYQMALSPSAVEALDDFISQNKLFSLNEEYGPVRADSGFHELSLTRNNAERKTRWGPFAKIPQPLGEMQTRLSKLIEHARQHPLQVVGAALTIVNPVQTGQPFPIEFSIRNRASEPVTLLNPAATNAKPITGKLHFIKSADDKNQNVVFDFFRQAQPISFVEVDDQSMPKTTMRLLSGQEIKMPAVAPFLFQTPGSYILYGFVELALEVVWSGEPMIVNCCMATQPITVQLATL